MIVVLSACTSEKDQQKYIEVSSQKLLNEIVTGVGGGKNPQYKIKNWEYDKQGKRYVIELEIRFNGAIINSREYEAHGILMVNKEDGNKDFAVTYMNDNFRQIDFLQKTYKFVDKVMK
jgi:hypothetical protein